MPNSEWELAYFSGDPQGGPSTLMDIVRPIELGDSSISGEIDPMTSDSNRFGVDVILGHPRMSIVEDQLSRAWSDALGGDIGGFRRTNWASSLVSQVRNGYNLIIFDVGPSLGSLNRTVLIGCDAFVTPMGADIFSLVAIRNISEWINSWESFYATGYEVCDKRHPDSIGDFDIRSADQVARFAGCAVQQYITKSKEGVRCPTKAFEAILERIPDEIESSLGDRVLPGLLPVSLRLGDVPSMYSLTPRAQSANSPVAGLRGADGLVGSQFSQ